MSPDSASDFIPFDYHMHSEASCDSHASMSQMCASAHQRGIPELAFTDHFDCHPSDRCLGFYQPDVYFDRLEAARAQFAPQGLTVRAGVELGEPHLFAAEQQPVVAAHPYDIVLGSLHWIGPDSVFDRVYFEQRTPRDAIEPYFVELAALARQGGFDVLAHPDLIKRKSFEVYGRFDIAEWEDVVRPVWQACIEKGIAIEINTAGLRLPVKEAYPAPAALRWYREMGGELLTLGSDAHQPDHAGYSLQTAVQVARAAGFTRVCSFAGRQVARWINI
jgi:histidinol-phosphatase (PHP family)